MADRVRGIQVHRPIIYGSHARLLTEEERATAPPAHTHKWTVFVTSATSPPPKEGDAENMDYLPGGADDLGYMIKRVTFKLHDTYTPSSRIFDKAPFQVSETGWGEFIIGIRIQFVQEASEKPLNLSHSLKLHHWGPPIQGALTNDPAAIPTSVPTSAAPTPAAVPVEEKAVEPAAEATATVEGKEDETPKDTPTETVKTETEVSTPAQSESIVAVQPGAAETPTHPPLPVSIATRLPVHSWQYDELVFSDPPAAFLEILNANPPTPLPAKFRRPKDQREKEEGPKKKKGRPSVVNSRAQTQEPGAAGTPVPAGPVVGIPGELGSADVPLEFAKEMETGEFNRLTDAKLTIIDQMDKVRSQLIAKEKELAKLKAEMRIS